MEPDSENAKVIELQTYLTDLGYGDLLEPEKIDGKFGPHTKNSVMAYQKDFGLSDDGKGIVGPQTWRSLCEQISLLPKTFPTNKIPSKDDATSTESSQCAPNTSCPKINIIYDVELVPQQTGYSCWAAGASMLVGWRDKVSINPEEIANAIGYWKQYEQGLEPEDTTMFNYWGLKSENPQSYTVQGFANLLQDYGPLWVASAEPGFTSEWLQGLWETVHLKEHLYILIDPWQEGMTTFSLPNTGSQHTETYEKFEEKQHSLAISERDIEGAIYVAHLPYDSLKVFKQP